MKLPMSRSIPAVSNKAAIVLLQIQVDPGQTKKTYAALSTSTVGVLLERNYHVFFVSCSRRFCNR